MKTIELTQGKVAMVDDMDYERVAKYKWYALKQRNAYYARRKTSLKLGKRKAIILHRFIMNAPKGIEVDHINHNGLDCRRVNMRLATNTQNARNRPLSAANTSGYKGVHWDKNWKKWRAQIKVGGKTFVLGGFDDIEEAAHAYDAAAIECFGEFAHPNFGARS